MDRRRVILLALAFSLVIGLVTIRKAKNLGSPDFKVFYSAVQHAIHDPVNIYKLSPDRYLYPPSTAILLVPFGFTENYAFHQWVWHALLVVLLFSLCAVGMPGLAAMFLLIRYLAITFSYGQINLVILALLALIGWLARKQRFQLTGCLWAITTSLKIYPVVFAPFFLPRRRWRAWGGAALVAALVLFLPFVAFGLELGSELYAEFFAALGAKGIPLHSHNQSIVALLERVFTNQEFYLHAVGPMHWGLLDLPPKFLQAAAWLIGAGVAAAVWWKAWKRGLLPESALSAAAFCVLFLSHIVWKDYLLFLYFPLREIFARAPRKNSLWLAGIFFAMISFSSPDLLGARPATLLDAGCIHLWAAVLVLGVWWKASEGV